jgi:hypothetical protein
VKENDNLKKKTPMKLLSIGSLLTAFE